MISQIKETINYCKFELLTFNRNVKSTRALEESFRRYGFLDAYPIHVVLNGSGKFKIKAGHHRFAVARKLNIPIKYIVVEDGGISIYELERSTRNWSLADYLESYCRTSNGEYLAVRRYHQRTGIALSRCIAILGKQISESNLRNQFYCGKFKVNDKKFADTIEEIVDICKAYVPNVATKSNFVGALCRIVFVEQFSVSRFSMKMKSHGLRLMDPASTIAEHTGNIERIYNFQTVDKIPLSFLADEAAKNRMPEPMRK